MTPEDLNHIERFDFLGKIKGPTWYAKWSADATYIYEKDGVSFYLREKPARTAYPKNAE